jgi:cold shock CspA family protein
VDRTRRSPYGIKDIKEFTDLLLKQARQYFATSEAPKTADDLRGTFEGKVLRLVWRGGLWFGFITRGVQDENVYFDSRGYPGEPRELVPEQRVRFDIGKSEKGLFARNVTLAQ